MSSHSAAGLRLLRARGLRPKRSFGQSFLIDDRIAAAVANAATTPTGGTVLEIGAGLGALTQPLLARAARVVAVERDRDLLPLLRERFASDARLELVEADAATLDWQAPLQSGPAPRVVAGNLPYAITGRLLQRAISVSTEVDHVVFMVQREVADRLCAAPGNRTYGALTVFARAAYDVERLMRVSSGSFSPAPKVESAVVVLRPLRPHIPETPALRRVVKAAFATRRKTLRNAWRQLGSWSPTELESFAEQAGIALSARAETLDVEAFGRMADLLERHGSPDRD